MRCLRALFVGTRLSDRGSSQIAPVDAPGSLTSPPKVPSQPVF